ncbi:MAG: hypothetical protein WC615_00130 [Mucilaginibacter sp.]|jgi:hypothetical protein|uniref:hypothetical protein n=1 Tax=Mucilaginibacter sp. TaxID=1882438 RepID=UPI003569EB5C
MIRKTSQGNIFVSFDDRSERKFQNMLYWSMVAEYGEGTFTEERLTRPMLEFGLNWAADKFLEVMGSTTDPQFLFYLLANHEESIKLYYQVAEPHFVKEGITENLLSLNRRILKLALEQAVDINYGPDNGASYAKMNHFRALLEDLLYLGDRLFAFSEYMAEQRMMENPTKIVIGDGDVLLQRQHHYEHIYHITEKMNKEAYEKGIIDKNAVKGLRAQLMSCFGIDYDFAGGQIFLMKQHLSPKFPLVQTIQYGMLIENLVQKGISRDNATTFYDGLTITRDNKLPIKDSVYQSGSFYRYFFRPILLVNINGETQALVGEQKWEESIVVMATNGFQWQLASEEWKKNECFNTYLKRKHDEHDKLLENEVQKILEKNGFYFDRNIEKLYGKKGRVVDIVDIPGEIDFIFLDSKCKKIMVTDCKYHRARYEMAGFSRDYAHFKKYYEKKMKGKVKYIKDNITLLKSHFMLHKGMPGSVDLSEYEVVGFFIINTPTFYIYNGLYPTITIGHLEEFMEECYFFGDHVLKYPTHTKIIKHPWFTVQ